MPQTKSLISVDQALQMDRTTVIENWKNHLSAPFAATQAMLKFDRQYVRAAGASLWDAEGNEYLDFVGGYGAVNLGHNHPRLLEAIHRVEQYPKIMQTAVQQLPAALAANLANLAPGNLTRVFFCNSGAESVEGALKLARASTGRTRFIYCQNSFHGKSFGALSVTGRAKYQKPFAPLLSDCVAVPFGDLDALKKELADGKAAAFIVEPIQGEAGIIIPPPGYLAAARQLCADYKTLFIADEVQTGLGRTGTIFACEAENVVPDVLCLAKSLGGGVMPAGAYITTDEHWKKAYGTLEKALLHTSTFGGYWGNGFACAVGITTLQVLVEENLAAQAREKGEYFMAKLRTLKNKYPLVKDVRGRGLLIGMELADAGGGLVKKLSFGALDKLADEYLGTLVTMDLIVNHRVATIYTLNNPNVIRLEPPLVVTREQIDRAFDALENVLSHHKSFLGVAVKGLGSALRRG